MYEWVKCWIGKLVRGTMIDATTVKSYSRMSSRTTSQRVRRNSSVVSDDVPLPLDNHRYVFAQPGVTISLAFQLINTHSWLVFGSRTSTH